MTSPHPDSFPAPHDPFASLRIPDFLYFILNSFFITVTLLIQEVIIGYELYKITRDPLALGLVGLAEAIPFIALSLFGGHLADRRDKKRILQVSLVVIMLGSVILYVAFRPEAVRQFSQTSRLAVIYGVLMLIGTARGFYSPASSSLKPFLVPRELYANSSTWSSSFWQAGAIVGPGVAGLLYAIIGFENTLLTAIFMYGLCFIFLSQIKHRPVVVTEAGTETGFLNSLREGFAFVFGNRIVFYAISLDLFSVLFGGVVAILPIFAEDILKVGAMGLGVLRSAPAVGAVLTMLAMAKYPPTHNAWRNMLLAVVGFGVATLIFALSTNFYLSLVMLALTGAFDSVSVIIRQTILQIFPPDHLRGRVAAVNGIFVSSSNEIGAFESGLAARILGTVRSVLAGGVFTLVVVGYVYTRSKDLFKVKIS